MLKVSEWKFAQQISATHCATHAGFVEFLKKEGGEWYSWILFRKERSVPRSDTEWQLVDDVDETLVAPVKSVEAYRRELFDRIVGSLSHEMLALDMAHYLSVPDLLVSDAIDVIASALEAEVE